MAEVEARPASAIVDIGGGASRLVDHLIDRGFQDLTVLDLSGAALDAAKARLGRLAASVRWIVADADCLGSRRRNTISGMTVRRFTSSPNKDDRAAYVARLARALTTGGYAIIATFAPDGPEQCSGLPVVRYDADGLGQVLGTAFELVHTRRHAHTTPWGSVQFLQFSVFCRRS